MKPRLFWPILLAVALLLLACFSPAFQDNQAWGHLKTGQYILQNRKLPVPDPFAFTSYIGRPAYPGEDAMRSVKLTREWLAQALLYLAYAAGGFPFVVLLRALLMAAASGLTGLVAFRRSGNFYTAIGAALLSAAIAYRFAADRPVVVTFLSLAAVLAIVEYRRGLWALPPLFLVWANCHGAFFIGWIVLAAYCAAALVRGKRDRLLWLAAGVSVLVSGLTPNGFHALALDRPLMPLVALCLAVAVPVALAAFLPWNLKALPEKWELALMALILAAIALPVWQKRALQFSAAEKTRPLGAVRFLLAHHVSGPLFNTAEQGGYLMWYLWPQLRVFADDRGLNETVRLDDRRIAYSIVAPGEKNVFQLLDQYGVQAILITGYDYATGIPHFLIAMLADPRQTQWKLVFQDGQAMVFLRQAPPGVHPLPNIAALTSMEAQCAAHIALVPAEPLCARETCKMYEHLGNPDRARAWMAYYLEHKKQADPGAETEFQRLSGTGPPH